MNQQWMNRVRDHGPTHPELCELVRAIADFANEKGVAWPAVPTLAEYLRVTERTVYRRLHMAREEGWITVRSGGGRRRSNLYTLVGERFQRGPETVTETVTETLQERVTETLTPATHTLTRASQNPVAGVTQSPRPPPNTSSSADDKPSPAVIAEVRADDDQTRQALNGIDGVRPTRIIRELVADARSAGWSASLLNAHLRGTITNPTNPMGCLTAALRDLPAAEPARLARPAWCGLCDERTRQREDRDGNPYRCPDCHPLASRSSPSSELDLGRRGEDDFSRGPSLRQSP
jgi:hypothetical protein